MKIVAFSWVIFLLFSVFADVTNGKARKIKEKSDEEENNINGLETNVCTSTEDICAICGKAPGIQTNIIGGQEADRFEYPWYTYLLTKRSAGLYSCGGTLISSRYVLTAAHCVDKNPLFVVVHLGLKHRYSLEDGAVRVTAKRIIIHSGWNSTTLANDIALIEIIPIEYSSSIQPICLPSNNENDFAGIDATAIGLGSSDPALGQSPTNLLEGVLKVQSNTECGSDYGITSMPASIICAKDPTTSICFGDSGGPLITKEVRSGSTRSVVIGVSSFVGSEGCIGKPNAFSRVSYFLGFILEVLGSSFSCPTIVA